MDTATRTTEDTSTLIDVILCNAPSDVVKVTVNPCDVSNHDIIGYARKINHKHFPSKIKISRDYKK